jgi:hypothetical protein
VEYHPLNLLPTGAGGRNSGSITHLLITYFTLQNGASRIKCDRYQDKHKNKKAYFPLETVEEHITCLQSTGICMYKAG